MQAAVLPAACFNFWIARFPLAPFGPFCYDMDTH